MKDYSKLEIIIHEGDYNKEQRSLINIWNAHWYSIDNFEKNIGQIYFTKDLNDTDVKLNPENNVITIKKQAGRLISKDENNIGLIRMHLFTFVLLMTRYDIDIDIEIRYREQNGDKKEVNHD